MKKYIYIDDEDEMAIRPIIDGFNQTGRIEVRRMLFAGNETANDIFRKLKESEYKTGNNYIYLSGYRRVGTND